MRPWRGSNHFASRRMERHSRFDTTRALAIQSCCSTVDPVWATTSTAFPEVLSPPYQVVRYNQRGCGPSPCDGTFEVEKQVADLDAIRTHVGAGRLHLFGHSWGGLLG